MFTGIVKTIKKIHWDSNNSFYVILSEVYNLGDSISVNGCCLTIDNFDIIDDNYKISFYIIGKNN